MVNTKIKNQQRTQDGWLFEVELAENAESLNYKIGLDESYYEELTSSKISPEDLVKKSFEFLLERESKESILKSFNLREIQNYFPEYESDIRV